MKVKISYTIEDSEIPNELAKFLEKAAEELSQKAKEVRQTSDVVVSNYNIDNLEQYFNLIAIIRKGMINIDTIMSDCQDILIGLNQIVQKQRQEELLSDQAELKDVSPPPQPTHEGGDE